MTTDDALRAAATNPPTVAPDDRPALFNPGTGPFLHRREPVNRMYEAPDWATDIRFLAHAGALFAIAVAPDHAPMPARLDGLANDAKLDWQPITPTANAKGPNL